MDAGITYSPDSIQPEYNIGFGIGGGAPPSISGQLSNAPGAIATPGCIFCPGGILGGNAWPLVIIVIAVTVLMLRK